MAAQDHKVNQINPENYEFVAILSPLSDEARIYGLVDPIGTAEVSAHMEQTNGKWAAVTSSCHICGSHHKTSAIWWHRNLNEYIRTGETCAGKMEERVKGDFRRAADEANRQSRKIVSAAISAAKAEAGASALKELCHEAWVIHQTSLADWQHHSDADLRYNIVKIHDICETVLRTGALSEGQINYLNVLLSKVYQHRPAFDKNATPSLKEGKQIVTGKIIGTRPAEKGGISPSPAKILLAVGENKIWMSLPSEIKDPSGNVVSWVYKLDEYKSEMLQVSISLKKTDDPNFFVGTRPTKPVLLTQNNIPDYLDWLPNAEGIRPVDMDEVEPTVVKPTVVEPTVVEPTVVEPTVVAKSKSNKSKSKSKSNNAIASTEEIISALKAAIALEETTKKAYRQIQKALSAAKNAGMTGIRCNSKKVNLLAEAKRLVK